MSFTTIARHRAQRRATTPLDQLAQAVAGSTVSRRAAAVATAGGLLVTTFSAMTAQAETIEDTSATSTIDVGDIQAYAQQVAGGMDVALPALAVDAQATTSNEAIVAGDIVVVAAQAAEPCELDPSVTAQSDSCAVLFEEDAERQAEVAQQEAARQAAQQAEVARQQAAARSAERAAVPAAPVTPEPAPAPEEAPAASYEEASYDSYGQAPEAQYAEHVEEPAPYYGGHYEPAPAPEEAPAPYYGGGTSAFGQAVVEIALSQQGTPYVWGGTQPGGFDCSGFTQWVFGQVGVPLPRTDAGQRHAGVQVSAAEAMPGDLIWSPGHVAIYLGNGQMIDAPRPGRTIEVRGMWQSNPVFIRLG